MAHISTIGAGLYSELQYSTSALPATPSYTNIDALTFTDIQHVREIPQFGTPANIVNVPVYGQKQSSQVQGQADAPTLAFTLNYVPSDHSALQALAGNGTKYTFRIRLSNAAIPATPGATDEIDDFAFEAQIAAFEVSPSLSDSNQATLTLAIDGDFFGPFTTA